MNQLETKLTQIIAKKKQLDALKPLPLALEKNFYEWHRIALTYTSNAIEGNTLTHAETAIVVEKNISIGGKSVVEHLEAIGHAKAIDFIMQIALKPRKSLVIEDILKIHWWILQSINPDYAGVFRDLRVSISGSRVILPNPLKVPVLMEEFMQWLIIAEGPIAQIAADAHLKFVFIHPFIDGNGRTARLIMNLIMLQEGYPLVIIDNENRPAYMNAIEQALVNDKKDAFYEIVYEAIEKSLNTYIEAAQESIQR